MVVEHLKFSVASSERFIAWRRKPCWWRIEIHKASSGLLGVGIKKPKAEKTLSSSQVPVKSPSLCFFFPPGWECAKRLVSKIIFCEGREQISLRNCSCDWTSQEEKSSSSSQNRETKKPGSLWQKSGWDMDFLLLSNFFLWWSLWMVGFFVVVLGWMLLLNVLQSKDNWHNVLIAMLILNPAFKNLSHGDIHDRTHLPKWSCFPTSWVKPRLWYVVLVPHHLEIWWWKCT